MNVLLINPPNCGRSIPEERYGITSLRQIFRGEPLALENLAGALDGHSVRILDLKVEPEALGATLRDFAPDLVALTAMTCEAQTVLRLARQVKDFGPVTTVVGGVHASNDPEFFNRPEVDYVVIGLGRLALRTLIDQLAAGVDTGIDGVAHCTPGQPLRYRPRAYGRCDLMEQAPPRYDLVQGYREHYTLKNLGLPLGCVVSAFGCPYRCHFCCIEPLTGGRYLTQQIATVVRDIGLLEGIDFIRLVDANTFGDVRHARALAEAIAAAGLRHQYLVDVRSDTVVRHPELLRQWKEIGLRSVVIGFEEIGDSRLGAMNKDNSTAVNAEAVAILRELGITTVGDFIVDPDYGEEDFDRLDRWLEAHPIDLPIFTVMTPLPGTALYRQRQDDIRLHDLDYYTLTNAVLPTRLPEERFYQRYADLTRAAHARARL